MTRLLGGVAVLVAAGLAADGAFARPRAVGGAARAPAATRPNAGVGSIPQKAGPPNRPDYPNGPGAAGRNVPGPADRSGLTPRAGGVDGRAAPPRVDDYRRFFDRPGPDARQPSPQRAPATAYGWANPAHRPFTPAWYAGHPKAWQAAHPHADVVAAAGAVGLARWLAVPSVWVEGGETVIYSGETYSGATYAVDAVPAGQQPSDETSSAAAALAGSGAQAAEAGRWMTIGEFALGPEGRADATRVIQLVVSQEGVVRGSHDDLVSEEVLDVRGAVDKKDLRIAWAIGPSSKVVFQAPLGELTKDSGRVTAFFPDGKRATWRVVRLER